MIEMKVAGIVLNAASRSPMILLKDSSERRALPIFIGQAQAEAIIEETADSAEGGSVTESA